MTLLQMVECAVTPGSHYPFYPSPATSSQQEQPKMPQSKVQCSHYFACFLSFDMRFSFDASKFCLIINLQSHKLILAKGMEKGIECYRNAKPSTVRTHTNMHIHKIGANAAATASTIDGWCYNVIIIIIKWIFLGHFWTFANSLKSIWIYIHAGQFQWNYASCPLKIHLANFHTHWVIIHEMVNKWKKTRPNIYTLTGWSDDFVAIHKFGNLSKGKTNTKMHFHDSMLNRNETRYQRIHIHTKDNKIIIYIFHEPNEPWHRIGTYVRCQESSMIKWDFCLFFFQFSPLLLVPRLIFFLAILLLLFEGAKTAKNVQKLHKCSILSAINSTSPNQ